MTNDDKQVVLPNDNCFKVISLSSFSLVLTLPNGQFSNLAIDSPSISITVTSLWLYTGLNCMWHFDNIQFVPTSMRTRYWFNAVYDTFKQLPWKDCYWRHIDKMPNQHSYQYLKRSISPIIPVHMTFSSLQQTILRVKLPFVLWSWPCSEDMMTILWLKSLEIKTAFGSKRRKISERNCETSISHSTKILINIVTV